MFTAYKDDDGLLWAEYVIEERFAEMLDELYPETVIAGMTYDTARALREVDPVAYRCALSEYKDDYEEVTFTDIDEYLNAIQ